jgi:hypothetical protein
MHIQAHYSLVTVYPLLAAGLQMNKDASLVHETDQGDVVCIGAPTNVEGPAVRKRHRGDM